MNLANVANQFEQTFSFLGELTIGKMMWMLFFVIFGPPALLLIIVLLRNQPLALAKAAIIEHSMGLMFAISFFGFPYGLFLMAKAGHTAIFGRA